MKAKPNVVGWLLLAGLAGFVIWQNRALDQRHQRDQQEIERLHELADKYKRAVKDPAFQQRLRDREAEAARLFEEAESLEAERLEAESKRLEAEEKAGGANRDH